MHQEFARHRNEQQRHKPPTHSLHRSLIDTELKFLWFVQRWRLSQGGTTQKPASHTRVFMDSIVSKYPLKDISIITWISFIFVGYDLGWPFVWCATGNVLLGCLMQRGLSARNPGQYDRELAVRHQRADIHPFKGFPSMESHMAVVVFGSVFVESSSWAVKVGMLVVIFIIGFSRIYAASRFPHQIVCSWLTGMAGLILSDGIRSRLKRRRFPDQYHVIYFVIVGACALAYLAWNIENNDSQILRIPKSDYVRVMSNIMNSEGQSRIGEQVQQNMSRDQRRAVKRRMRRRDSMFHFMRGMEKRSRSEVSESDTDSVQSVGGARQL